MILGAIELKIWVFEVFRRSLGRAGMCQPARVDHLHKKKLKKGQEKNKLRKRKGQVGPIHVSTRG
jgi:hypothetical protein